MSDHDASLSWLPMLAATVANSSAEPAPWISSTPPPVGHKDQTDHAQDKAEDDDLDRTQSLSNDHNGINGYRFRSISD